MPRYGKTVPIAGRDIHLVDRGETPVRAQTRGPVSLAVQGGLAVVIQASHQYGPGMIRKIVRGLTLTSRFENVPTQAEKAQR